MRIVGHGVVFVGRSAMADERAGITRRAALRHAAVGAGLVWAAPAIRTVKLVRASGTAAPPPPTTTGTVPVRTIDFAGTVRGGLDGTQFGGPCNNSPFFNLLPGDFVGDLSNIGSSRITQSWCFPLMTTSQPTRGTFRLTAPNGAMTG